MLGYTVEFENEFGNVLKHFEDQFQTGLEDMAEAVRADAFESMPVHPDYESAPAGEPPYSHTETFRKSLRTAAMPGHVMIGVLASEVGLRGAWFEFGGRPPPEGAKRGSRGKRHWKQHPFLGPALDRQKATFAPRVAQGGFT